MNIEEYKNKYLKYKNKYLTLKNQYGGMMDGEEEDKKKKSKELLDNEAIQIFGSLPLKRIPGRIYNLLNQLFDNNFYLDEINGFYNFVISDGENKFNVILKLNYPFSGYIIINNIYMEMTNPTESLLELITSYKNDFLSDKKKILIICHNRKINIDNIEKDHQCFIVHEGSDTLHSSLMEHIPPNSKLITLDINGTPDILTDLWDESFIENFKGFFDGLFMLDCHTWNKDKLDNIEIPIKAITHTRQLIKDSGFAIYSTAPHVIDKVCEKIKEMNLKCKIIDEKAQTGCHKQYLKITSL